MANLSNINNKFLVTDEGKVGIGITAPTGILHTDQTFSGYAPVTFKNSVTNQGQFVELITSTDEGSKYTGIESKSLQTGNGWKVWGGGNNFGEMYLSVSGSPAIVIKNDLKVGIGTTSPGSKLEIEDNVSTGIGLIKLHNQNSGTGSGNGIDMLHYTDPTVVAPLRAYVRDEVLNNWGTKLHFGTVANGALLTEATTKMTIDSAGNVGIGVTDPDAKLEIKATGSTTGLTFKTTDGAGNENFFIQDGGRTGVRYYPLTVGQASGTSAASGARFQVATTAGDFVVMNDGKVGIGETSPGSKLEIGVTQSNTMTPAAAAFAIKGNGGDGLVMGQRSSSPYAAWIQAGYLPTMGTSNHYPIALQPHGGNVGIGTVSPGYKLEVNGNMRSSTVTVYDGMGGTETGIGASGAGGNLRLYAGGTNRVTVATSAVTLGVYGQDTIGSNYIQFYNSAGTNQGYIGMGASGTNDFIINCESASVPIRIFNSGSERMRIRSGGEVNIGSTGNFSAGKLVVQQNQSENGGIVTLQNGGTYGYYTRVCHNATTQAATGYWHIKTNIPIGANIMFMAKFYGYIYGSAQVLDLTHVGYAYSGTNTVINQGVQNNGNNTNASSAIYTSANGSKVTFRIAFGAGATFSTYFAGVYMDMAFPSPAGQGHDFQIEAQSFSQSATVY